MQISKEFQAKVLYFGDVIKIGILNFNANIINTITRHFNQAQHIKELTIALKDKEKLQYSYDALHNEYNELLRILETDIKPISEHFELSRVISFVEINKYTRVWLEQKDFQPTKEGSIYGLISDNKVAGIALFQNRRLLGLLNGDEKCSYSVAIGAERVPGIIKYDINKEVVADYIPLYAKIEVGDMVYTSGFDGIFYPGILVGEIESLEERQGYQVAVIKPALEKVAHFYWVIDSKTSEIPLENKTQEEIESLVESQESQAQPQSTQTQSAQMSEMQTERIQLE